ncbi:DegT/DnrJ/EryC1/StrS family aminotransferase, partial [Escherichia coli]|uniref:DegT/DnrJ/EryC1/StrS family aminotransferase n=1 Tax=Escherichia coli TaxID=562 RepID=UPI001952F894
TLAIRQLCRDRGVILIEDCAQSMGTEIGGESLIGGAAIATTSFYPAKVLGASGDAGGVFFRDDKAAGDCRI